MKWTTAAGIALLFLVRAAPAPEVEYFQDFEKAEVGKTPDEILVVNGTFAVQQEAGNRFLRAEPTPLDGFNVMFGADTADTTAVEARIRGSSAGKRFPELGVGLCGPGGYKLWLMPATGQLQLIKGENVKATRPYEWKSGTWTHFKLQMQSDGEKQSKIVGKAWADGAAEPGEWMLAFVDAEKAPPGRASAWGSPYSETPVDFDDLKAGPAKQ